MLLAHGLGTAEQPLHGRHDRHEPRRVPGGDGYDIWLLDGRGSWLVAEPWEDFTLDEVAKEDWPAAIAHVRERAGAVSVHVVAEGAGALALHAALASGLEGVGSVVSIGAAPHVTAPSAGQAPSPCASDACRKAAELYGELYRHERLNASTHDRIHELVAPTGPRARAHLALISERGRLVSADGSDAYVAGLERLSLPLTYVHGAASGLFAGGWTSVRSRSCTAARTSTTTASTATAGSTA